MKLLPILRSRLLFLERRWFNWIANVIVFANPIAIFPQLHQVITASSVEGVSVFMFLIFAVIQMAFVLIAIQKNHPGMFWSMAISFSESILIIIITFIKKG